MCVWGGGHLRPKLEQVGKRAARRSSKSRAAAANSKPPKNYSGRTRPETDHRKPKEIEEMEIHGKRGGKNIRMEARSQKGDGRRAPIGLRAKVARGNALAKSPSMLAFNLI